MITTTLTDMKTDNSVLSTIWQWKLRLQRLVMFITSIGFTTLVFIQVVSRYVFNHSFFGIEEAASFLAVTMYFIGAAYGTQAKGHISASIIDTLCKPGPFVDISHILTRLISALLCVYLSKEIWHLVLHNQMLDVRSVELRMPMVWIYSTMLVGTVLMSFYFFVEMIEALLHLVRPAKHEDEDQ